MGQRILLVEGTDDQHVVWNLFEMRGVPERFMVRLPGSEDLAGGPPRDEDGGDTVLLEAIPRWLLHTNLECLAIVLDADDNGPEARWQSIRMRLENAGYQGIPQHHSDQGTVFELSLRPQTPRSVRFGVWIMPDNRSPGMLEDFVTQLIREDDDLLPLVDQFIASIPEAQRRFSPAHHAKARIHSWLAVSERPGRPMGQAIKADRHFNVNHLSAEPFLSWINVALVQ